MLHLHLLQPHSKALTAKKMLWFTVTHLASINSRHPSPVPMGVVKLMFPLVRVLAGSVLVHACILRHGGKKTSIYRKCFCPNLD